MVREEVRGNMSLLPLRRSDTLLPLPRAWIVFLLLSPNIIFAKRNEVVLMQFIHNIAVIAHDIRIPHRSNSLLEAVGFIFCEADGYPSRRSFPRSVFALSTVSVLPVSQI
jgi:hypothetical protein